MSFAKSACIATCFEKFISESMLKQFEKNAERKLLRMVFDYYAGGSNDEITLKNNIKV